MYFVLHLTNDSIVLMRGITIEWSFKKDAVKEYKCFETKGAADSYIQDECQGKTLIDKT